MREKRNRVLCADDVLRSNPTKMHACTLKRLKKIQRRLGIAYGNTRGRIDKNSQNVSSPRNKKVIGTLRAYPRVKI